MNLYAEKYNLEINKLFSNKDNYFDRIDDISATLLGAEYKVNPLGEDVYGEFDQAPLYRSDFFDCLTFVNAVIALSRSGSVEEFSRWMIKLNYRDQKVDYLFRHHFMTSDWNPCNQKLNIIKEYTVNCVSQLDRVVEARAFIDKKNWLTKKTEADLFFVDNTDKKIALKKLQNSTNHFVNEESIIHYIPMDLLLKGKTIYAELVQRITPMNVIELVRPNWDLRDSIGTCLNVSHLGFLIKKGEDLIIRHASKIAGKVVEADLRDYLEGLEDDGTIGGLNIQKLCDV